VHDSNDALILGEVPIATGGITFHFARCNAARYQSSEISTRVHLDVRVASIARVEVVAAERLQSKHVIIVNAYVVHDAQHPR
jgi:hypothetical protein